MSVSIKSPTSTTGSIQLNGSDVLTIESDNSVDIDSGTLHVDATNNRVGIGTSSPATNLVVNTTGVQGLQLTDTSTDSSPRILFTNDTNTWGVYNNVEDLSFRSGATIGSSSGTERVRIESNGDLKFNSGYGSVATAYGCRAWVNFNGTGTVAIRASGNVSSITDNGTGDYTMNFSTSMTDANYCVQTTVEPESANANHVRMSAVYYNTRATGSVRLRTGGVPTELGPDPFGYFVAIIR